LSCADSSAPPVGQAHPVPGKTETEFVTDLLADIRDKVAAYLARTGMPEREFGKLALGRADFVAQLAVQRRMTLDTADRLLRFMGEAPIGPEFVREVEAFLEVTGIRPARLGIDTTGAPWFVDVIRTRGTTRLGTVDLVRAHIRRTANTTQRTVIEGMLDDGGQRSSAVAAGAVPQCESEGVEDSEVSGADADAEGPSEPHRREFLNTDEAATVLGVSPKMLSRFRAAGTGPAYHRFGYKVAYAYTDLLSWALSRRQTTRESE